MDLSSLDCDAVKLVETLAKGCDTNDLVSATITIYDMAWLAMVSGAINGDLK